MVNAGIIGALGYTGKEIIHYLSKHPLVRIRKLWDKAVTGGGQRIDSIFPEFKNVVNVRVEDFNKKEIELIDVLFLALPHTVSMKLVPDLLNKVRVLIDLSADYRFKDHKSYQKWYGVEHADKKNIKKAVYGLPEINRAKIKGANFIANPGCYPTSMILGLYPLAKEGLLRDAQVIVDSKTGASGAGRKAATGLIFSELSGNLRPYKINKHQHMPEVVSFFKDELDKRLDLSFIPQIIPIDRGIISMIYVVFKEKKREDLYRLYKKYYSKEPFIRLSKKGESPELKSVAATNFCDLGHLDFINNRTFLIISCIDNLGKGAASQAVQNMNIALDFREIEGLI
jgi:N-acetyl-gamma-glutamyl-phosphate reductase